MGHESDLAVPAMSASEEVPLEQIEHQIRSLSGQIAAATAALLGWIAEYDRREGWASWGCQSAAQWLSWKCGDSLHTAREKVRVARALEHLPEISAALAGGEVSYSKVRAITRVAVPGDETDWLVTARESTGSQLERIVASVASALDRPDAATAYATRSVTSRLPAGGKRQVKLDLPTDMADIILGAVEIVASRMIDEAAAGEGATRRSVIAARGGVAAIRADAMLEIAERVVADDPAAAQRGDVGRLALVVEVDALREGKEGRDEETDDETRAEPECAFNGRHADRHVARRLSCDALASVHLESGGHGCDVGRETRIVPRRLRRALHRRDNGMCRFPGCGATSWLHAHHVIHWADHGETALDNLVSVCGFHHSLIHEGGFTVAIVDHTAVWADPGGVPLLIEPLEGDLALLDDRFPRRPIPEPNLPSRPIDFRYVVSVIAANAVWHRRRPGGDVPAETPEPATAPASPALTGRGAGRRHLGRSRPR